MNTRLTVADCRSSLYAEVDPSDVNTTAFLPALNEVCERFINSGKWKGALVHTVFPSAAGFITLPYDFLGVLSMRYDRWSGSPIFSQYRQYMEFGPGEIEDTWKWPGALFDMGDGFPTQTDIPEGVTANLRITLSEAGDAGKAFRFFGVNGDGKDIFSTADGAFGIPFTSAYPSADTPTTTEEMFSRVTGIQAPNNLVGSWTLSYMTTEPNQIGFYLPSETRPMYRRYQTGVAEEAIKVLCQRRFVLMRDESDWVIPGNLSALRYGLKAWFYEQAQDLERADAAFQQGINWLNQEAKASRGGVRPDLLIQPFPDNLVFPWTT